MVQPITPEPASKPLGLLATSQLEADAETAARLAKRPGIIEKITKFIGHIAGVTAEIAGNEKEIQTLTASRILLDKRLDNFEFSCGKYLFDLRATYIQPGKTRPYSERKKGRGWDADLDTLCAGTLKIATTTAHKYIRKYTGWVADEALGKEASKAGLLDHSKEVLATKARALKVNPNVTNTEICAMHISETEIAAARAKAFAEEERKEFDSLVTDFAGYGDGVTITRIGNQIQVWAKIASTKDVPTVNPFEVEVRLMSDQVQTIVGPVAIGVLAKTPAGVRRFLEGCEVEQKLAVEKGAGAGK